MAVININTDLAGFSEVARTAPDGRDEVYNVVVASGVIPGEALYQMPIDGSYIQTSALASGTAGFRGISLQQQVASGTITMLRRGKLWGYDLAGLNYDDPVYLSNTVGMLDTVVGTANVLVGRVVSLNEAGPNKPKVLYIDAEYASGSDLG